MGEKQEAKRDGARLQKNSGRGQYSKGDAAWHGFLIDYKHYKKSFSISIKAWAKVCTDALKVGGLEPLIKVVLNGKVRLAVVDWDILEELVRFKEEHSRDCRNNMP